MRRCGANKPDDCPYTAITGSAYCYFHDKVNAGLISAIHHSTT
ncbi:MAG: hypothetical protein WD004_05575 [Actinomycetota bacterium]